MSHNTYTLLLAGMPVAYRFLYPETVKKYSAFITGETAVPPDTGTCEKDFSIWEGSYRETVGQAEAEYRIMVLVLSGFMLSYGRCVCHAVAVRWKGLVWLFSAHSGTGKTTLFRNWKEYLGEEAEILSGDMPFLECRQDGSVWVHASPWNGKEGYHGEGCGRLGGILFLRKGLENRMERLTVHEALLPVFGMFLVLKRTPDIVHKTAGMAEHILKGNVPVWRFENTGDLQSAEASCKAIAEYMEKKDEDIPY